jgi:phosphomannomutase
MTQLLFDPKILRAYDIRGIYPQEISPALFQRFGQVFGADIRAQGGKTICIGYDGRLSSPVLEAALVKGLLSTGLTIYRIGCCPSPLLYFAEKTLKTDGALMVTGSHNPKEYNGLKMIVNHRPFFGQAIQAFGKKVQMDYCLEQGQTKRQTKGQGAAAQIEQGQTEEQTEAAQIKQGQGEVHDYSVQEAYVAYLLNDFQTHYIKDQTHYTKDACTADGCTALRVAWDPGNGAAGPLVEALVQQLPGEHFVINSTVDGHFPAHHPDPTLPENLQQLRELVLEKQCDLGIAFDGDADRIGVIDNEGEFLWGDQFLLLFAEEILQTHPGATILADVKASQIFFQAVEKAGGKPLMVSTGHSNIKSKMRETGALLAGEMSGHVFFADRYYGYDDALYAAIRLLGIMVLRRQSLSLSAWRRSLPPVVNTPEIKIPCADHLKHKIITQLHSVLKARKANVIGVDGVRVISECGWWLLRASNTQDYLVGRVEADSVENLAILKEQMRAYLADLGVVTEALL